MNRLREVRFFKGVSQYRLALLAQMQQPRISLIENDLVQPREEEVQRLARALGVRPEEIWGHSKEVNREEEDVQGVG